MKSGKSKEKFFEKKLISKGQEHPSKKEKSFKFDNFDELISNSNFSKTFKKKENVSIKFSFPVIILIFGKILNLFELVFNFSTKLLVYISQLFFTKLFSMIYFFVIKVFIVLVNILFYFLGIKKILFLFFLYYFIVIPLFFKFDINFFLSLIPSNFIFDFLRLEKTFSFSTTSPFVTFFENHPRFSLRFFNKQWELRSLMRNHDTLFKTDFSFGRRWTLLRHYGQWFVNMERLDYVCLKDIYHKGVFPYDFIVCSIMKNNYVFILFHNLSFSFFFLFSIFFINIEFWSFVLDLTKFFVEFNISYFEGKNLFLIYIINFLNSILILSQNFYIIFTYIVLFIYSFFEFVFNSFLSFSLSISELFSDNNFFTNLNNNIPFFIERKRRFIRNRKLRGIVHQNFLDTWFPRKKINAVDKNFFSNLFYRGINIKHHRARRTMEHLFFNKNFFYFYKHDPMSSLIFLLDFSYFSNDYAFNNFFKKKSLYFNHYFLPSKYKRYPYRPFKLSKRFANFIFDYNFSIDQKYVDFSHTKFFLSKRLNKKHRIYNRFSFSYLHRDTLDLLFERFNRKRGYLFHKRFLFFRRLYENLAYSSTLDFFDYRTDLVRKKWKHKKLFNRGFYFSSHTNQLKKVHYPYDKFLQKKQVLGEYFKYIGLKQRRKRRIRMFHFSESINVFFISFISIIKNYFFIISNINFILYKNFALYFSYIICFFFIVLEFKNFLSRFYYYYNFNNNEKKIFFLFGKDKKVGFFSSFMYFFINYMFMFIISLPYKIFFLVLNGLLIFVSWFILNINLLSAKNCSYRIKIVNIVNFMQFFIVFFKKCKMFFINGCFIIMSFRFYKIFFLFIIKFLFFFSLWITFLIARILLLFSIIFCLANLMKYLFLFSHDYQNFSVNKLFMQENSLLFYDLSIYESSFFTSMFYLFSISCLFLISYSKEFKISLFNSNLLYSDYIGFFDRPAWSDFSRSLQSETYLGYLDSYYVFSNPNPKFKFEFNYDESLIKSFNYRKIFNSSDNDLDFFWFDGLYQTNILSSNSINYLDVEEFFLSEEIGRKTNKFFVQFSYKFFSKIYSVVSILYIFSLSKKVSKKSINLVSIFYFKKIVLFLFVPKIGFFLNKSLFFFEKIIINFLSLLKYFLKSFKKRFRLKFLFRIFYSEFMDENVNKDSDIPDAQRDLPERPFFEYIDEILVDKNVRMFSDTDKKILVYFPVAIFYKLFNRFTFFITYSFTNLYKLNIFSNFREKEKFFTKNIYFNDKFLSKNDIFFDIKDVSDVSRNESYDMMSYRFYIYFNFFNQFDNDFVVLLDSPIDDTYFSIFSRGQVCNSDYFRVKKIFLKNYSLFDKFSFNIGYLYNFQRNTKFWFLFSSKTYSLTLNSINLKLNVPLYSSKLSSVFVDRLIRNVNTKRNVFLFLKKFFRRKLILNKRKKYVNRKGFFFSNFDLVFLYIFNKKPEHMMDMRKKIFGSRVKIFDDKRRLPFEFVNFSTRRFFCGRFFMKNLSSGRLDQTDDFFPFLDIEILFDGNLQFNFESDAISSDRESINSTTSLFSTRDFVFTTLDDFEFLDEFDSEEVVYNAYSDEHPFSFEILNFYGSFEGEYSIGYDNGSSTTMAYSHEIYNFLLSFDYSNKFFYNVNGWVADSLIDRFLFPNDLVSSVNDILLPYDFIQISNFLTFMNRNRFFLGKNDFNLYIKSLFCDENLYLLSLFSKIPFFVARKIQNFVLFKSLFPILNYSRNKSPFSEDFFFFKGFDNKYIFSLLNNDIQHVYKILFKDSFVSHLSFCLVFYNPYNKNFLNLFFNHFNFKILTLTINDVFRNKYTFSFFQNIEFHVSFLRLNNFPNLNKEEAERLWAFLGCSADGWFSSDKNFNLVKKSYNNWEFPVFYFLLFLLISVLLKKQQISLNFYQSKSDLFNVFERDSLIFLDLKKHLMREFMDFEDINVLYGTFESVFTFRGYFHPFDPFFIYYKLMPIVSDFFINITNFLYIFPFPIKNFHYLDSMFFQDLSGILSMISFFYYQYHLSLLFFLSFELIHVFFFSSNYFIELFLFLNLFSIFFSQVLYYYIFFLFSFLINIDFHYHFHNFFYDFYYFVIYYFFLFF